MLNVGFGLGLVDRAIQSNSPASHTIIEAHPDVLRKVGRMLLPSVLPHGSQYR